MINEVYQILIADDDAKTLGASLRAIVRNKCVANFTFATSPEECRKIILNSQFDLVFLDINFGPNKESGVDLIPIVISTLPDAKVYMMSSLDEPEMVARSISAGAQAFISKNEFAIDEMALAIYSYVDAEKNESNVAIEGMVIAREMGAVFKSQKMSEVFVKVAEARRNTGFNVFIQGETGVGKEVIAKAINFKSARKLVEVDCGAITETLAESELFGHAKGAFTGSVGEKSGRFQQADGGDLFLDEIGNLKQSIQVQLLRAIQNQKINPVGSTASVSVKVRVIAATNAELRKMTETGSFRHDLFQRLNGINIVIPPLRDRSEDIEVLLMHFISNSNKPTLLIKPSFIKLLECYDWPGNVRELENATRFMVSKCGNEPLGFSHLPLDIQSAIKEKFKTKSAKVFEADLNGVPMRGPLNDALDVFLKSYLMKRFQNLGSNVSIRSFAKELQIPRSALDRYEKKFRIGLKTSENFFNLNC